MSKKAETCIGLSREAWITLFMDQKDLSEPFAALGFDELLRRGFTKECGVHPGHYIQARKPRHIDIEGSKA